MSRSGLSNVLVSQRLNAVIGWVLIGFLSVMAVASVLDGEFLWAVLVACVTVLALVPVIAYRGYRSMLPWEVMALAALPVVGRVFLVGETIGGVTLTGRVSTYFAVAAVALILAVELDVFTPVRMNDSFAIFFVVIATMATAGVWAVLKWLSDVLVGTAFMLDGRPEALIERALMWDFVAATVVGLVAGVVFEVYFRRFDRTKQHVGGEP